jgi:hypothetical protein
MEIVESLMTEYGRRRQGGEESCQITVLYIEDFATQHCQWHPGIQVDIVGIDPVTRSEDEGTRYER